MTLREANEEYLRTGRIIIVHAGRICGFRYDSNWC